MQKIDHQLLKRLQTLSMVEVDEAKKDQILEELNKFLEFVDILDELDYSGVEATFSPIEASAPLRKDEPSLHPEIGQKILQNAPKSADNFFIVPKIIE
ncbi:MULTISPECIES: Asp-tRNA(Asn)/Glu-tRNA(Gln) amidotransferase subunit GatC [unclassified Nitratiruptor]|uniref:Asp-tRNA(Asn)/Glu-tRNA(Gln) amidotransferase subunit GatC n=1 Tax=unclassified Nitratiruptor TaxID=2624044 RepID=UPI001914E33D|nr:MULTISPECIES: Asp-tRNA(Asn)/Glu-tRNA(Gln) amidotransferase subunit GatC [unclassified Nitratiruptor]BCD60104.1 aspartyl-tRNA(Asn)/glutamyl-tRNA(Gln) amidotransferase subunit C [Nitratiruptor sp. YY08-10]BCD64407.1 aspartyl-tRNA(Asn)/glutamyl-tRNA(Gln) amidotransferase subunit C [Nitratiruptor sp. YY08-14]